MKKNRKRLWKVFTGVFSVILIVLLVGTVVANHFYTSINAFLQCPTYKVIKGEDAEDNNYYPDEWEGYDDWFEYYEQELCARTEAEGAVLMKNENHVLPLASNAKVSLFSHSSVDMIYGGTGSGSVNTSTAPNLKKALEASGAEVNPTLWSFYNTGNGAEYKRSVPALSSCAAVGDYSINEVPWSVIESESGLKETFPTYSDAAIFVLSRSGGEGLDLATTTCTDDGTNGDYLTLTKDEKDTLLQLKALKDSGVFKSIIVLVNSSNAVQCNFIDEEQYSIDSVLWIAGVGAYGNIAVANILLGVTNPSGRLVDTFLNDNFSNPSLFNHGDIEYPNAAEMGLTDTNAENNTNVNYVVYQEGIYIGYKYYETRYEDQVTGSGNAGAASDFDYSSFVYRPFGYGQSYTDFSYDGFQVDTEGDDFVITVNVTNVGSVSGKHTVQIYMQKPYTSYDRENGVEKSSVELVGFDKTKQLAPNQSETVTITVPKEFMKSYDANGAGTYIVDEGTYYLTVGTDAHHAINNILAAKGYNTQNSSMDADGDAAFVANYEQSSLDTKTYSVSEATGNPITNQFDHVDLNKYSGSAQKVTYLSRNDWMGTYPTGVTEVTVTEQMATDIKDEFETKTADQDGNPYEKPTYGAKNGLTLIMMKGLEYDDPAWDSLLDQMTYEEQADIIVNAFHNTRVANSISKPASIETNGPQGITNSFFGGKEAGLAYPAEVIMAATWNRDIMAEIGSCIGIQGLKSRTNGVYGPGGNIHRNPYCGRNYEYYSEDSFLSGALMAPEVKEIQSQGVYAFMKHFALNDQETNRAGVMVWANEQAIRESYLRAFEYAVTEANIKGAMTVMNRIGTEWGGASQALLTNVLRKEWGFDGIVITDYSSNSNFTTQRNGLQGGSDIWDGFAASDLPEKASDPYITHLMRQAMHRLLYVQVNSSVMNGISSTDRVVTILTWWQQLLIALDILFAVLAAGSIAMLVISKKKKKN